MNPDKRERIVAPRYLTSQMLARTCLLLLSATSWFGCSRSDQELQSISFDSNSLFQQLEPLGRAIGDSRIVLLGENGHGVGDFTRAKVKLVEWLHEEHGFEVVAFESGFFECGYVWSRIDSLTSREAYFQCLRYAFQHAELLPLFEYIWQRRHSSAPLELAGMDLQAQGFDSEIRPEALHEFLSDRNPELADAVARIDTLLFLPERSGGLGDSLYAWAAANADHVRNLYAEAAAQSEGWEKWIYRLAAGWVDRLEFRGLGLSEASSTNPGRYVEIRDEWMANAIAALADSIDGKRKVVVWLHNDHARYGVFESGGNPVHSVGGYLRERYGSEVFSVGFFMGSGSVVDNGRNERTVEALLPDGIESFLAQTGSEASYLVLRGNNSPEIRQWAGSVRPYLRMGFDPKEMIPAEEFDALIYLAHVSPPNFDVP